MYGLFPMLKAPMIKTALSPCLMGGLMAFAGYALAAGDIQFNTDILDLNDRSNIDLSPFSRSGFILPGVYPMNVQLNNQSLSEHRVAFMAPDDDPKGSEACLSPELIELMGLKEDKVADLIWWKNAQCLDMRSLPGMEVEGDLSTSALRISLPQAYLQYTAQNWDPPSRWDEGVSGLLFDYNLTTQTIRDNSTSNRNNFSGNGTDRKSVV